VPVDGASERAHGVNNWESIFDQLQATQRILGEEKPARILMAGGDCSVDIAIIDYLNTVHDGLTVVWIDAHLDANTPDTSLTGAFHGMPVAALLGAAPAPIKPLMGRAIRPDQFFYYGVRVRDEAEQSFECAHALRTLQPSTPIAGPVHIHFDLDVLNPEEFCHLSYAEEGGPGVDEAIEFVAGIAAQADVVGLTITEFSPADAAGALQGQAVIERLCIAATPPHLRPSMRVAQ
jgi:arginase